jgi:hypothetical protein
MLVERHRANDPTAPHDLRLLRSAVDPQQACVVKTYAKRASSEIAEGVS